MSGFGSTGPKADQKVYDYVIQAMTGMADLQQGDTGAPQLVRQFVVDKATAITVSQAITAALFAPSAGRAASTSSCRCSTSGCGSSGPTG